ETQRDRAKADLLSFTALNALSFEVLAGQILILFARKVGASIEEIGLLAALLPFASVIQLGVAPLVNRFGPRRLMLAGWAARTAVAAVLLLVPLVSARAGTAAATRMLLAVMGAFYLCRALGMSSWLPMVQEIVRPPDRGSYLSRQEWLRQVSIVLIAVVTAIYLLGAPDVTRFLHVMTVGVITAAWSLSYLWRLPDVGLEPQAVSQDYFRRATAPLRDGVFRQYLAFSVTLRMVLSAIAPFLIVFLREGLHLPTSGVIAINTIGSFGAIATLGAWGRWSDRVGAKPALAASICGMAGALALWSLTRGGSAGMWLEAGLVSITLGIFTAGLTVAMSKFELGFIPLQDRTHYVAMNVTAVGIGSAIATLLAGQLIHALASIHVRIGWLELDQYRIFFLIAGALLSIPLLIRTTLPEERSRSIRALMRRALVRRSVQVRRLLTNVGKSGNQV
ncbi:MAG: transporter, partial [Armatimonadetes bacterium]|nr:transporter [Armatimonadota bacterium]